MIFLSGTGVFLAVSTADNRANVACFSKQKQSDLEALAGRKRPGAGDQYFSTRNIDVNYPDKFSPSRPLADPSRAFSKSFLERGQILNDLKITQQRVGLILDFKRPHLEWERLVL